MVKPEQCQTAFDTIKQMVASDLVLTHHDPELPLSLATDASPYGIGAVLSQTTTEGEKPKAFASRTLSKPEENYSARQQRYAAFLLGLDYSIEYRTSKANANADSLSRLPLINGEQKKMRMTYSTKKY